MYHPSTIVTLNGLTWRRYFVACRAISVIIDFELISHSTRTAFVLCCLTCSPSIIIRGLLHLIYQQWSRLGNHKWFLRYTALISVTIWSLIFFIWLFYWHPAWESPISWFDCRQYAKKRVLAMFWIYAVINSTPLQISTSLLLKHSNLLTLQLSYSPTHLLTYSLALLTHLPTFSTNGGSTSSSLVLILA